MTRFLCLLMIVACSSKEPTPSTTLSTTSSTDVPLSSPEACDNGLDDDLDGLIDCEDDDCDCDLDGDGFQGEAFGGPDCDDEDALIFPGAVEVCDEGVDNNCDGLVDDQDDEVQGTNPYFEDLDGDGFGVEPALGRACVAPPQTSSTSDDCDDQAAGVHPEAQETCDGVDNDCDALVDDDDDSLDSSATAFFVDADGDRFGDLFSAAVFACEAPSGYVTNSDDCDDSSVLVSPERIEVQCDLVDNDCDITTADDPAVDADGDGFTTCQGDCDDTKSAVNPDQVEVICTGLDEDCDGSTVDDLDADSDGVGSCFDDCDDNDPLATRIDEWIADVDGDGFGAGAPSAPSCWPPSDGLVRVSEGVDCDDNNDQVFPGNIEICSNELDDDCDGEDLPCNEDTAFEVIIGADFTWDSLGAIEGTSYETLVGLSGEVVCDLQYELYSWSTDPLITGPDPLVNACVDIDGNPCDLAFTVNARNGHAATDLRCAEFAPYPYEDNEGLGWGYHSNFRILGLSLGPRFMYNIDGNWYLLMTPFEVDPGYNTFSWTFTSPYLEYAP